MTDADLIIKGLNATWPALVLAVLLGASALKFPRVGPWAAATAAAGGMLISLRWFGGERFDRWMWVVPTMIAWSVAAAMLTLLADDDEAIDEPPRYPAVKIVTSLVFALVAMTLASFTLYDGDGPDRAVPVLLVPIVLAAVAGSPKVAHRMDAIGVAAALGCGALCILLVGNDTFFHTFLALPTVAGVFALLAVFKPKLARASWVLLPGLAIAVAVAWNSNIDVPDHIVIALLVIGYCPVLLALAPPPASAWLPGVLVSVIAVSALGYALLNTDLSGYGIGSPPPADTTDITDPNFDWGY
ncbi:MAG: hypothetical protein AAGD32_06785 [Planctomycetota bacterium]